jgi:hypothetical protein
MRSRAAPVTASIETWRGGGYHCPAPPPWLPRPGCPEPPPVTRTASISCQVASRGGPGPIVSGAGPSEFAGHHVSESRDGFVRETVVWQGGPVKSML